MIRSALPSDEIAIRSMLEDTYRDSDAFNDYFFTHIWKPEDTVVTEIDGVVCASAQLIPAKMRIGDASYPTIMDYGATVLPAHRGQGHLKRMNLDGNSALIVRGVTQRICYINLKAVKPWQSIGYQPAFPLVFDRLAAIPGIYPALRMATLCDAANIRTLDALYNRRFSDYARVDRTAQNWLHILAEYALEGGVALLEERGNVTGYAVFRRGGDELTILECAAADLDTEDMICQALLKMENVQTGIRHLPVTPENIHRATTTGATARIAPGGMPDIPYEKGYLNLFHQ